MPAPLACVRAMRCWRFFSGRYAQNCALLSVYSAGIFLPLIIFAKVKLLEVINYNCLQAFLTVAMYGDFVGYVTLSFKERRG
jgi:hypothetical protein